MSRFKLVYILFGCFLFFVLIWCSKNYWKINDNDFQERTVPDIQSTLKSPTSNIAASSESSHSSSSYMMNNDYKSHPFSHPKKRELLWTHLNSKEDMLIRRLGYIDDRFTEPFIVLISMHNGKTKKHNYFAKITYRDNNGEEEQQCLPLEYWIKSGNLNLKHNLPEIYINYILRTKGSLLKGKVPHHLTVTLTDCKSEHESNDIMIWNSKNVKRHVKYGVCLHKGLFNINNPQLLVDWIEIHKALGVESITVYLEDVTENIVDAIQPYVKEGLVDLLDWKLGKVTRDYGQSGVMTECHYINMHSVEYLGTYDLDEVVVPAKHMQWKGMFEELSENNPKFNNYASFLFHGLRWHDGHRNETINSSEILCTKVDLPFYFRKTIRDDGPHDHPKTIIRPLLTMLVQVHDIGKCIKGKIKEMRVNGKIATCHHYRVPDNKGRNVQYDNFMSRYKENVYTGIRKTLCK